MWESIILTEILLNGVSVFLFDAGTKEESINEEIYPNPSTFVAVVVPILIGTIFFLPHAFC